MHGPGKYDGLLTEAREKAGATSAVLIIMDGDKGGGFAVQVAPERLFGLPEVLEEMAKQVRADLERYKA